MTRIPGGNPIGRVVGAYGDQTRVKKNAGADGKPPAGKTDKVELSSRAQEVLRLREQLAAVPDVRAEQVEALRRAIADGTYRPDYQALAEKLLKQKVVE